MWAVASHPKDSVEDVHGVLCVFHLGHEVVQPDEGAGTTNASTTTNKGIGRTYIFMQTVLFRPSPSVYRDSVKWLDITFQLLLLIELKRVNNRIVLQGLLVSQNTAQYCSKHT